jgi:hypothetical protein
MNDETINVMPAQSLASRLVASSKLRKLFVLSMIFTVIVAVCAVMLKWHGANIYIDGDTPAQGIGELFLASVILVFTFCVIIAVAVGATVLTVIVAALVAILIVVAVVLAVTPMLLPLVVLLGIGILIGRAFGSSRK